MSRSGRLWRKLRLHGTTPAGVTVLTATFFAGVVGSMTLVIPVYHVFCILVGLQVGCWVAAQLARRRLRVEGFLPPKAVAGVPVQWDLSVTNLSSLPAWDVGLRMFYLPRAVRQTDGDVVIRNIPPGGKRSCSLTLAPARRGLFELPPVRAFTTFPFNLMRTGRLEHPVGSLLVLPHFTPLEHVDVPVSPRYQPGGIALAGHVGESPEYIGNREYQVGDSLRKIDFRSWARLARPVTREYQEEYYCRVALVCDTYVGQRRKPGPEGYPDAEAAISLSAALADALGRGEYVIDIFAAGPELYVLRTGRGTTELESILEILASVEPCRSDPFEKVTPALADELERISSVVFVLLDWDAPRRQMVRVARQRGCMTKVVVVRRSLPSMVPEADRDWADEVIHVTPREVAQGRVRAI